MPIIAYRIRRLLVKVRRTLQLWPWAVSVAVHVAILAIFSTFAFITFTVTPQRRQIVPEARLGRVRTQLPVFQRDIEPPQPIQRRLLSRQMERQMASGMKMIEPTSATLDIISELKRSKSQLSAVAMDQSVDSAPRTRFFNTCGNAYSVVFVVDRSGSMLDAFRPLKRELKKSLGDLRPMQKLHVIFFSTGKPIEGPAGKLTWASDRNKSRYVEFIDDRGIWPEGETDPLPAVKRALELDPDLIYLLTDGVFSPKMADQIIQWSKARKVKINTIAYLFETGGALLRQIAEQTGGVYRFVSEDQLEW